MAMYREHFGLQDKPFSIAPDPRFLYMSQRHREALAHLLYGLNEGGGFVQLTGEVGTGKTTICRCLLEQLPDNVDVALILNPKLSAAELVASICDELKIEYPAGTTSLKSLIDLLNAHLLTTHGRGQRTVLIIDEAQNLSAEVLEQVRLLTNLETSKDKLLQIILIGQPELSDLLGLHEMRQLAQRITARYHLDALSKAETRDYIQHRLRVCSCSSQIFQPRAVDEVHRLAGGVPRLINIICDRSLLGAYVENKPHVDTRTVRKAAAEVGTTAPARKNHKPGVWAWVAVLVAVVGAVWFLRSEFPSYGPAVEPQMASAEKPPMVEEVEPAVLAELEEETTQVMALAEPEDAVAVNNNQPATSLSVPAMSEFEVLLESPPPRSWQAARWALLARWGIEPDQTGSGDSCAAAKRHSLGCMRGQAGLGRLRIMDRPALLELTADSGKTVPVVLQTLDRGIASIELGGSVHQVPLVELREYWKGQYIVFWKSPITSDSLGLDSSGDDVVWLRSQMQRILQINDEVPENPQQFDEVLQEQVRRFQGMSGLQPDGVAGKRTLININSLTPGTRRPRLLAERR